MPKAFDFGRLFFPGEAKPIPDEVRFQPLGNHVGNVMELVKLWHKDGFPFPDSLDRVLEAAKIHDMGKPKNFSIKSETSPDGKFKKYIYSFKGHRFDARSPKSLWAQTLAIGHHDFSIHDIARDTYKLKKEPEYTNLLIQEPLAYARELYILEMCDQIEAELACRVLGDDDQAESRAFMEFTIAKQDATTYLIDPWPFETNEPITMTFRYWSMCPQEIDEDQILEKCLQGKDGKREADLGKTLDKLSKDWWREQTEKPKEAPARNVILQPYLSEQIPQTWTATEFYQHLGGQGFEPKEMQKEVFDAIYDPDNKKHPAILLKAPTGIGKTEAVVFPALASGYRLILPLPARSLLDDQKKRIEGYLTKISELYSGREFSLVVDTGSQMYRYVYKNGELQPKRTHQNPRRHLYKADIILTTLDKFLYRYFAFGDRQKSFIFPLRIHEAVSHQKKTLICFDEAHSYEQIAFTNFQSLVRSLYEAGRSLVLMTATMPPQIEDYFDYLQVIDYTKQFANAPKRQFAWLSHITAYQENEDGEKDFSGFQEQVTQVILQEWQSQPNRRILAVVETVRDAAEIYRQLKKHLGSNTDQTGRFLFLYHGRIADQLRPGIYKGIKDRDDRQQPYIVVTTRAIEVGCDLNSEILISQLCPPENLIQRVGRCNRRGDVKDARVIVVGNEIPEFANTLTEDGWQGYQQVLSTLSTFDTEQIVNCISHNPHIDDYRVVELFSMLHDYVYGADLTCQPTHEQGLIPTRSWEPSAELRLILSDGTPHSISVPISRLASKNEQTYAFTLAYERYYDQENTTWCDPGRRLRWGSAYDKDIVITISDLSDFVLGVNLPVYPYDPDLGFVKLPRVFSGWIDGAKVKLKYEEKKDGSQDKHIAIIHYTKSLDT
jgi:CRISPR-associated endonuclease/helicase Cas3